jgi:hypothetical protein
MSIMRKRALIGASIVLGTTLVAAPAIAVNAIGLAVSPETQTVASGQTATWGTAWAGKAPYNVTFYYGDGDSTTLPPTSSTAHTFTHAFSVCVNTNFTERLHVKDATGAIGDLSVHTTVTATGRIC